MSLTGNLLDIAFDQQLFGSKLNGLHETVLELVSNGVTFKSGPNLIATADLNGVRSAGSCVNGTVGASITVLVRTHLDAILCVWGLNNGIQAIKQKALCKA